MRETERARERQRDAERERERERDRERDRERGVSGQRSIAYRHNVQGLPPPLLPPSRSDSVGCTEIGDTEVFRRSWTKAEVRLDCRAFEGKIDMR